MMMSCLDGSPCSATRVVPRGTTRGVKKLSRTHLPNLGKLSDISEYLLGCVGSVGSHVMRGGGQGAMALQMLRHKMRNHPLLQQNLCMCCAGGMPLRVMVRSWVERGK